MCPRFFFVFKQVSLDGLTGPVKFNENGKRRKIELEILNLRNNLFKSVSSKEILDHRNVWKTYAM